MSDLNHAITINLKGDLVRQSAAIGRQWSGLSRGVVNQAGVMRRAVGGLGRGLDALGNRWSALAAGAAGAGTVTGVVRLDARLTRLGTQAQITGQQVDALRDQIFEVAQMSDVRVDPSQLLDAVEAIVEKTGDVSFATSNLRGLGLAIQASGARGRDIGALVSEFKKLGLTLSDQVIANLDTLVRQGKEGAFTVENLATMGERAVSAFSALGYSGDEAVQGMGALLQVARMGTGSAEQATTAFEGMLRTIVAKGKDLQRAGISVFDPEKLKQGVEEFRPMPEIVADIIRKAEGRASVLQPLFGDEGYRAI
ncbi:phage tail tape measure protein, partial [Roseospirillum parvum]